MASLPIGNIYAPPWMCVAPSVAGYQDIEFDIDLPTVTIPANTIQPGSPTNGQTLTLDADYDFLVRELQFVVFPVSDEAFQPSDLRVRIRDPFGRLMTSDYVQVQNLNGALPIIWALKRAGILTFDFWNVNTSYAISVQTVLKGWKRMACPGAPAIPSAYVPMYKRYSVPVGQHIKLENFEYYYTFKSTGIQDLLRIPLQTDNDADFLWRGIQGDWSTTNNDVDTVGNVGLVFRDPTGIALSTTGLTCPWGSTNCGNFRESVLSNGGGRVAPIFPEIRIPHGGVVEVDISFGAAETVRFSLRGMKVYQEGK
jgi:hypothetical protein